MGTAPQPLDRSTSRPLNKDRERSPLSTGETAPFAVLDRFDRWCGVRFTPRKGSHRGPRVTSQHSVHVTELRTVLFVSVVGLMRPARRASWPGRGTRRLVYSVSPCRARLSHAAWRTESRPPPRRAKEKPARDDPSPGLRGACAREDREMVAVPCGSAPPVGDLFRAQSPSASAGSSVTSSPPMISSHSSWLREFVSANMESR